MESNEALPTFLDSCEGLAVYGGNRVSIGEVDEWVSRLGIKLTGTDTNVESAASIVPEDIQTGKIQIKGLDELSTYGYEEREITVWNNGQNIYGIAYVPDTGENKLPLVICSHGLGGSYRSFLKL